MLSSQKPGNSNINDTLLPIYFDHANQIKSFHEKIKGINSDELKTHLLVACNGETYFLDDLLVANNDDNIKFLCRNMYGIKDYISIQEIRELEETGLLKSCYFTYNRALAEAFISFKERNSSVEDTGEKGKDNSDYFIMNIPECPIQHIKMPYPSITVDGYSYGSISLDLWLKTHDTDPQGITGPLLVAIDTETGRDAVDKDGRLKIDVEAMKYIMPNHSLQSLSWTYWEYQVNFFMSKLSEIDHKLDATKAMLVKFIKEKIVNDQPTPNQSRAIEVYNKKIVRLEKISKGIEQKLLALKSEFEANRDLLATQIKTLSDILTKHPQVISAHEKDKLVQKKNKLSANYNNILNFITHFGFKAGAFSYSLFSMIGAFDREIGINQFYPEFFPASLTSKFLRLNCMLLAGSGFIYYKMRNIRLDNARLEHQLRICISADDFNKMAPVKYKLIAEHEQTNLFIENISTSEEQKVNRAKTVFSFNLFANMMANKRKSKIAVNDINLSDFVSRTIK